MASAVSVTGLSILSWLDGTPFLGLAGVHSAANISIRRGLELAFRTAEDAIPDRIRWLWVEIRGEALAPLLRAAVVICLIMSVMLLVEVVYMAAVSLAVKLLRWRPEKRYKWEPMGGDLENGNLGYPMVLVQIPMYNEKEVYKLSIGAACGLAWPTERIIIQVLDDSTDPTVKDMVELECKFWASKVNSNECLMTRIQKMSLDYHFKVEQEAGSSTYAFFGFNGTAGVWRISAINESGGWKDRTTVEDMDLAVRASLKGWKFVYVGDLKVKSELPSNFKAYRYQQHRWTCGAANLFRKMAVEIVINKEVSLWKKLNVIYSFFFVRKIVSHIVTFVLYCLIVPVHVMVPEVSIPAWGIVYIPTAITILNAIRNPSCIHLTPFWILFENVMAMHRMKATMIGLLEYGGVNEWVVTEKLGDTFKDDSKIPLLEKTKTRFRDRIYLSELGFSVFLFFCACYDHVWGRNYYCLYIYLQSMAFFIMGFGYVGIFKPNY